MFAKKFTIKNIDMPEQMRVAVLDQVRRVIQNTSSTYHQTQQMKQSLQKLFGGEWQVVIGQGQIGGFFSKDYIANYIELKTQTKTMLLFRRIDTQFPIRNDQKGDWND